MRLAAAIEAHQEALREASRWNAICADWTAAFGFAVWREGHPADREKLRQRRIWRQNVAASAEWVRRALAAAPAEGHA